MSLKFYSQGKEQIEYVGWLLAADSPINTRKGARLIKELSSDEQEAARLHSLDLLRLYNE